MVQEDLLQRRGVGEQLVKRAGGQGREGGVSRGEDGERAGALQGLDEAGGRRRP